MKPSAYDYGFKGRGVSLPPVTQPARTALSTRADTAAPSNPTPDGAALSFAARLYGAADDEFPLSSQEAARAGLALSRRAQRAAPADEVTRSAGAAALISGLQVRAPP